MNKNFHELPIYKSQAQRSNLIQPSLRLYGSGATINSPVKQSPFLTKRESQTQRAIDSLSSFSKQSPSFNKINHLSRSKSGEHVKWQSPTKQTICGESFKSIIEEINEQNDRTFSQLDQDLIRIKNNLSRIQKQSVEAKQSSHCQALSEQIQILQEQNQRLREKNVSLTNQKRKMTVQIEHYETLIQREKAKQSNYAVFKPSNNQNKVEELASSNRKLKQQLELKENECEKIKSLNSQLNNGKIIAQKRQCMLTEEKNKLLSKISQLQKEVDCLKLRLQEQLKIQLDKKDAYYTRIINNSELKYQQTVAKLKQNLLKSAQAKQQLQVAQNNQQIQSLHNQISKLKNVQRQFKISHQMSSETIKEYKNKMESLKNQIQLLNFSYRQGMQQLMQKQSICNQLHKQRDISLAQSKRMAEEIRGFKQRLEQQCKKNAILQQLCNNLQRQLQQNHYEAQIKHSNLTETCNDQEKELHKLRLINESIKKENKSYQSQLHDLSHQNEKYAIEIKRKTQEMIQLKKENLILLNDTKNLRLHRAMSPQKPSESNELQYTQNRLQRLHSARQSRDQSEINIQRQKQLMKMKKIQKQLNQLISECKIENERTRIFYKQKESKLQETINGQKQKIQQFIMKVQHIQNELHLKKLECSQNQQQYKQNVRKKQTEYLLLERKYAQIGLKLNIIESQNIELKKKIAQSTQKLSVEKGVDCEKKLEHFRSDYKRLLDVIHKEIILISENTLSDLTNIRPKDFLVGSTELKSYEQLHKIAQINYSLHILKDTFRSLHKRIKENTQSTKMSQHQQNSNMLDRSSLVLDDNTKQSPYQRKQQRTFQFNEDHYHKILLKSNQLQKKYERLVLDEKRKSQQLDDLSEEYRSLKRQFNRLKSQCESLEDEKQNLRIKLKHCEQRLLKKQDDHLQKVSPMAPTKEIAFYRQSSVQSEKQALQSRLRGKIRSFKSVQKRQNDQSQVKDYEKKILQYQMSLSKLNRLVESKLEQAQWLEKEMTEIKEKQKKCQLKYNKKCSEFNDLQEKHQRQQRQKVKLQSKIYDLELQLTMLVNQIDKNQLAHIQKVASLQCSRQIAEKLHKQSLSQKDIVQKKMKKDIADKEQNHRSAVQQYQLRIIDLTSQINKLKQGISQLTIKHDSITQKCDNLHQQLSNKQEKIVEYDMKIVQLRERLQKQSKQKENMLNLFSSNTSRLTKLLQQKEIQIEELKFIQQSTIINLEYARNQQNRKKQNDSAYSFKNQF